MPFLSTDFPRNNIICIPSNDWVEKNTGLYNQINWLDGKSIQLNQELDFSGIRAFAPNYGLLSNYYDIVKDDFFVDTPTGAFSQLKFNNIKKNVDSIDANTSDEMINEIQAEIDLIDEPVLKKYIQDALEDKLHESPNIATLKQEAEQLQNRLDIIREQIRVREGSEKI